MNRNEEELGRVGAGRIEWMLGNRKVVAGVAHDSGLVMQTEQHRLKLTKLYPH